MSSKPKTLILRTAGTNCDAETAHAFQLAGAATDAVHVNRLLENPTLLDNFQILAIPGGFSYGDDIAAGRILANQLSHHLGDPLRHFVETGRPVIGICNGFQVLVKTSLLPGVANEKSGQTCTLANNDTGRFIDRWIALSAQESVCIWTRGIGACGAPLELPIAHGEGKFVPGSESIRQSLWENKQVALIYVASDGSAAKGRFPDNPNGSTDDIAGVCDRSGLVFGLMPHPERYVDPTQHPAWTSRQWNGAGVTEGPGLRIFRNAVAHVREAVGAGV